MPGRVFTSSSIPIDARVHAGLRAKMLNNEFVDFGALATNVVSDNKYQIVILAVINATYAVAKRKPEKIRLAGSSLRGSSLHLFLHSAVQIYEFHIFIISSSSFPGILRTNLMTSSQLAC